MFEVRRTERFIQWLDGLSDARAVAKIAARAERLAWGNFGDVQPVGEGVSELRIHYGPGYRVYFGLDGMMLVVLLLCGDKRTQEEDIAFAKVLWTEYRARKPASSSSPGKPRRNRF